MHNHHELCRLEELIDARILKRRCTLVACAEVQQTNKL